jgi:hypothetical protein
MVYGTALAVPQKFDFVTEHGVSRATRNGVGHDFSRAEPQERRDGEGKI